MEASHLSPTYSKHYLTHLFARASTTSVTLARYAEEAAC